LNQGAHAAGEFIGLWGGAEGFFEELCIEAVARDREADTQLDAAAGVVWLVMRIRDHDHGFASS